LAHSLSAQKRVRQNEKHAARNRWRERTLRNALKELNDKLLHGTYAECVEPFKAACRVLDVTAQNGVIHKNTSARKKSRLAKQMKAKKSGPAPVSKK
jgi:small subunit ribosomal protein S20